MSAVNFVRHVYGMWTCPFPTKGGVAFRNYMTSVWFDAYILLLILLFYKLLHQYLHRFTWIQIHIQASESLAWRLYAITATPSTTPPTIKPYLAPSPEIKILSHHLTSYILITNSCVYIYNELTGVIKM